MIKAVFDANVVAASIPAEVSITWAKPRWRIRMTDDRVEISFSLLRRRAEITPFTVTVEGVASHPEDDMVLATAVSAEAEYLVSGDKE